MWGCSWASASYEDKGYREAMVKKWLWIFFTRRRRPDRRIHVSGMLPAIVQSSASGNVVYRPPDSTIFQPEGSIFRPCRWGSTSYGCTGFLGDVLSLSPAPALGFPAGDRRWWLTWWPISRAFPYVGQSWNGGVCRGHLFNIAISGLGAFVILQGFSTWSS